MKALDLFSAAAGGWSLGLHRAGFETIAACEVVDWRRALYSENNPGVRVYDDVCTLTADRILADLGTLPDIIVGSPPCQDISSANTKGKGVDGARSGLFFEAVRLIGECRPRWFALENSANLRTRGADRVIDALAAVGYTCWPHVVGVDDVGGNNERKRAWLIGCDIEQVANSDSDFLNGRPEQSRPESQGRHLSSDGASDRDIGGPDGAGPVQGRHGRLGQPPHTESIGRSPWAGDDQGIDAGSDRRFDGDHAGDGTSRNPTQDRRGSRLPGRRAGATAEPEQQARRDALDAAGERHEGRRAWGHRADGDGSSPASEGGGDAADPYETRHPLGEGQSGDLGPAAGAPDERNDAASGRDGSGDRGRIRVGEMGLRQADRLAAIQHRPDWSLDDLARHIRLDDGLPAWVAEQRIAVGGPRGTSAASLIVEAFGDSVCPQIPEAIGRAILRTEAALAAIYDRARAA
jgi:DNA (cytosine-5)-methyltransferase 1